MTVASNAVTASASEVGFLVPVCTTPNVTVASNAVKANASIVRLLAPVRATSNVTVASYAVTANASIVRLIPVRTTTSVALERVVVGESDCPPVFGALVLLQA